jgi:heptosyltransferase-2
MLLQPLNIPLSDTTPRIFLTEEEKNKAQERLHKLGAQNKIIIGINPGAAYGSAKCWLPDRFQKLTQMLLEDSRISIVYFGDKAGTPLVDSICNQLPDRVINLAGQTTLRELIALIGACDIFLTNDSGPMHIASALNIPLLALFGSTNDTTTGPYLGGKVIHKHVECSPCYLRTCPVDFRCMKKIEVAEVYGELQSLLNH